MQFLIENFKGIQRAHIVASPIALVCGHNGKGKSSIIEAIGACLDGLKQPYDLKKDDLGEMIHHGAQVARVTIQDDNRETTGLWPAGTFQASGRPFRATSFATGAVLYSSLDATERLKSLSQYLKTEPDKNALAKAIKEIDRPPLDDAGIDALWQNIQRRGWDGAHQDAMTEGTELKGAWKNITKAQYGTKVGAKWRPEGWTDEHEITKVEQLQQERKEAVDALEKVIGKVAINDQEKTRLEALTKNIPKLKKAIEDRESEVARLDFVKKKAEADLKKIPVIPKDEWPCCPHCSKPVQILGADQLRIPPAPLSAKQKKDLEDQLAQAESVFNNAFSEWEKAIAILETAKKDLKTAQDSKSTLESSDPTAVSAEQIQEYRDEINRCDSILAVKKRIDQSISIHIEIMKKISIVEILAPDGLRAKTLRSALEKFNQELRELAELAGWEPIEVMPNGQLTYPRARLSLSSGGERMKADILMQIALGMRDGSEIFLIDEADILDGDGRNGLFALLQHTGQHAVVAMMLLNKKAAPDLAKAGIGNTYWIEQAAADAIAA